MRIEITVKSSSAVRRLHDKVAHPAVLLRIMGRRLERTLQDHFRELDRKPNKRGWRKAHFWSRIRKATTFTGSDDDSATVSISEGRAFGAKLYGGYIRPTGGRKFLAIPAVSKRNGISPRAADDRDMLKFRSTRRGGMLGIVRADGSFAVQYWLVREAHTPADPNALPTRETVETDLKPVIEGYLKR